jgi:hypothetical protein
VERAIVGTRPIDAWGGALEQVADLADANGPHSVASASAGTRFQVRCVLPNQQVRVDGIVARAIGPRQSNLLSMVRRISGSSVRAAPRPPRTTTPR